MLYLSAITKEQCLGWVLSYPELAEISFSMENPKFDETQSKYLAIHSEDDILGVVKYEYFCEYGMQIHPYLSPKYWHTSKLQECFALLKDFFLSFKCTSLITLCPEDAEHAINACLKLDFKKIGCIEQAVDWKGKINNMIMLQRILR